ncbi:glycosyltransferase family 4 protein [Trinickia soli]|uniref:Glycosyl transferase n=1 Tax=Trinickia soli TaxID=380675 RepID=A0A2N7WCR2_9BURK|nr:glycosyltransferase family 4 protein [Trinickia soli]KAA0083088.1 glycosyltransferase [Paraburkholderia sp. T12-10]PMS27210.1 glycosyl transferase [Trinickia soli]CAB3638626.1 GDP-mannose-dependent alpha-(1-6)-phosphatidylinositol monomannoside mannosyltransferase [Trinickia soli]
MRILQLVLAPRLSGAEMLVKGIAIGHRQSGHTVGITSLLPPEPDFADAANELAAHDVACIFPLRRHEHLARLVFLYRVVRRFAPDVVFAHTTIPALYARALPVAVPIVFVMHSGMNDFTENRWLRRAERALSRRASAVIGVAQRNLDQYVATIGPHRLLFVVPNGVDLARFRHTQDAPRAKQIVQIGRYMPEKNQLDTVRAFREVLACEPGTTLHLCGVIEDRDYHAQILSLVDALGIAASVRVEGPRSDVPDVLARADVFAMPSRFEAHSIGFLEALASGIPIVANEIAAFAFARDYPSVSLVDTTDIERYGRALTEALTQPRSTRPLEGLTLEDTARRYLEIAARVAG